MESIREKRLPHILALVLPSRDKWIFMDFRDHRKACPKDEFPLPNIYMIIDLIARHKMLSLMHGFLGYNYLLDPHRERRST